MNSNLQKLIAERKKQAEDRQIWKKADLVAKVLGHYFNKCETSYGSSESTDVYTYEKGDLKIVITDMNGSCSDGGFGSYSCIITYKNKVVFNPSDGYIPGAWESDLDQLIHQVEVVKKEKEKVRQKVIEKQKRESERKEREKWGL